MRLRTLSAITLMAILIGSAKIGGYFFGIVLLIFAILSYRELFRIKYQDKSTNISVMRFLGYICLGLVCLNNVLFELDTEFTTLFSILCFTIPVVFYNDSKKYSIIDSFYLLGSVFFLGFSFHNIIYMGISDMYKCILIFLIAFVTDTYAYIGGMLIGKHPLTSISPNKTVEGSVIGTIMGCLVGTVYYHLAIGGLDVSVIVLLCFILTVLSEIGDLVFSSIKRFFNQKDYSNLIPGHGGVLDRFDSVIFVSLGLSLLIKLL